MDGIDLVTLRLRAGLRQYQLAARLGVTQTMVCDLERGRRTITPEIEQQIRTLLPAATKEQNS